MLPRAPVAVDPSVEASTIAGPVERNRKEEQDMTDYPVLGSMTYYLVICGSLVGLIVFLVIYRRRQE